MPPEEAIASEVVASVSSMEAAVVATALVIGLGIYFLIRASLGQLLNDMVKLPAARKFFLRILLVAIILSALAATVGVSISGSRTAPFMEKVWEVASSLSSAFGSWTFILMGYAILLTIMVAALGRRNEQ